MLIILLTARDPDMKQIVAKCVRVCQRNIHFNPAARGGRVGDILDSILTMKPRVLGAS